MRLILRLIHRLPLLSTLALLVLGPSGANGVAADPPVRPLRALLITGGTYHNYEQQKEILTAGISARANVEWTVFLENGDFSHKLSIYDNPDWAKGYDVVVHNECFCDVTDHDFIERILAPHRSGIPAVIVHCTVHTFRKLETDEWREFLGVTSHQHGRRRPLEVKNLQPGNPIMKQFPLSWKTVPEELFAIEKVWPRATPLAMAAAEDVGQPPYTVRDHIVIWTNTYGKGRVFGTSMAHDNATMQDPVYLDMVTRGLLWACDKLTDGGQPKPGYGTKTGKP
jgi:type 1 glutamine amidotransferase